MNKPTPIDPNRQQERLLGAALHDHSAAEIVAGLSPQDFDPLYRHLFAAIRESAAIGQCATKLSYEVSQRQRTKNLSEVCGEMAIFHRCNLAPPCKPADLKAIVDEIRTANVRKAEVEAISTYAETRAKNPDNARRQLVRTLDQLEPQAPLKIWGMNELIEAANVIQHPPLIDGLLRRTEVMNLIAAPKSRKSWLVLELATCLEHGQKWLGFQCTPASVLLIDNELRLPTLKHRADAICKAKGIASQNNVKILSVRGQPFTLDSIPGYVRQAKTDVVILDALYRFFPEGFDENGNADMTRLYNDLDRIATEAECAIICVHHTSKGSQGLKSTTDVGSGAGAQSRAVDAHVVLRPIKMDGNAAIEQSAYLDCAVRSFPPSPQIQIDWQYPLWTVSTAPVQTQADRDAAELEQFIVTMFRPNWESATEIHDRADAAGLSNRKFDELRKAAMDANRVEVSRDGNRRLYKRQTTPEEDQKTF